MIRTSFVATAGAKAAAALSCFLLMTSAGGFARAAEIKLLCAIALQPGVADLLPQFEKSSGHKVTIAYGTVGALTDRLQKGEAADVAIVSGPQIDDLQRQGKIAAGSRVDIAKVGVGIFVRKGGSKPDISSVEGFKRSLSAAKSIAFVDPADGGAIGIYMASLLERLGIAAEMKPKTKLFPPAGLLYDNVASGEVEIGFNQISGILAQSSVELVGPLPASIQNYTLFAAGIGANSTQAEAGKALVIFLGSPAAQAVIRSKGYEPI